MSFGNTCTTDIYNQLYISNIDKIQESSNTVNYIWLKPKYINSNIYHPYIKEIQLDFECNRQYNIDW